MILFKIKNYFGLEKLDKKHHLKCHLAGIFLLSFLNIGHAKTIFKIPNNTPYLNISSSHQIDTTPLGPTDFVVFNHSVGVLDSDGNRISFFDHLGKFIKKINLPDGYYQRLMRDKDNRLYAFSNDGLQTRVLKIVDNQIQKITMTGSISNIVSQAVIDDMGIFFQKNNTENSSLLTQIQNNPQNATSILKKISSQSHPTGYRINRDCFSCDRIQVQAPYVNGLSYQIKYKNSKGDDPILMLGNKKITLIQKLQNAGTRIEQIDSDGTVWIEQSIINNDQKAQTYVLKILVSGEVDAIYHLPNIHPDDYVEHQIAISDKGELWFMQGQPNELLFDRIEPMSKSKSSFFLDPNGVDVKKK